jgi:hypothetical protein
MDDNVLAQRDIHYGPRKRTVSTAIVTDVDSLIRHYHRKDSGVSRTTRSDPAVWWARSEEMERISCGEKPRDNYDHG